MSDQNYYPRNPEVNATVTRDMRERQNNTSKVLALGRLKKKIAIVEMFRVIHSLAQAPEIPACAFIQWEQTQGTPPSQVSPSATDEPASFV